MTLLNSLINLISFSRRKGMKRSARLEGSRILTLSGTQAVRLTVLTGALWLTRTGQDADVVLRAGQTMTLPKGEKLVLQGLPTVEVEIGTPIVGREHQD